MQCNVEENIMPSFPCLATYRTYQQTSLHTSLNKFAFFRKQRTIAPLRLKNEIAFPSIEKMKIHLLW